MVLIGNILSAVTDVNVTDCNKLSVEVQDLYPKIYICTCSQVVKASGCNPVTVGSSPTRCSKYGGVAQQVEHWTENPSVVGSTPTSSTIKTNYVCPLRFVCLVLMGFKSSTLPKYRGLV